MRKTQDVPVAKAKQELGFERRATVQAGVDQCVAWLKTLPRFR